MGCSDLLSRLKNRGVLSIIIWILILVIVVIVLPITQSGGAIVGCIILGKKNNVFLFIN